MPTLRLGIPFTTTHVRAEDHGFARITAVRYAPGTRVYDDAAWQDDALSWHQAENGDLMLGARPFEQAAIEIEGVR